MDASKFGLKGRRITAQGESLGILNITARGARWDSRGRQESPRYDALRRNGVSAAPRRACRRSAKTYGEIFFNHAGAPGDAYRATPVRHERTFNGYHQGTTETSSLKLESNAEEIIPWKTSYYLRTSFSTS